MAPLIVDVFDSSIQGNFDTGGRWDGNTASITPFSSGSQAWAETLSPPNGESSYTPLTGEGELRRSVTVEYQGGSSFVAGSNKEYASIHQYGGVINHPGGVPYINIGPDKVAYLNPSGVNKAKNRGRTIKYTEPSTIYIPPRPYLVLSEDDAELIIDLIREYYFGNSNQFN